MIKKAQTSYLLELVQELCKDTATLRLVLVLVGDLAGEFVVDLAEQTFNGGEASTQSTRVQLEINFRNRQSTGLGLVG